MAKAVFTMGASSCIESFVVSRTLAEGHPTGILALIFVDATVAVIGEAVAFGVGSVIGLLFAIVDSTILTMAGIDERRPPLPPPEAQP